MSQEGPAFPARLLIAAIVFSLPVRLLLNSESHSPVRPHPIVVSGSSGAGLTRLRPATLQEAEVARIIEASFRQSQSALGMRYEPTRELPPAVRRISRTFRVFFLDADYDVLSREARRFTLELDGGKVTTFNPTFAVSHQVSATPLLAFHVARLALGRHAVQIRDAARDRLVYDGDILVNGIDEVRFEISQCATRDLCRVVVVNGMHIKYRAQP